MGIPRPVILFMTHFTFMVIVDELLLTNDFGLL